MLEMEVAGGMVDGSVQKKKTHTMVGKIAKIAYIRGPILKDPKEPRAKRLVAL